MFLKNGKIKPFFTIWFWLSNFSYFWSK